MPASEAREVREAADQTLMMTADQADAIFAKAEDDWEITRLAKQASMRQFDPPNRKDAIAQAAQKARDRVLAEYALIDDTYQIAWVRFQGVSPGVGQSHLTPHVTKRGVDFASLDLDGIGFAINSVHWGALAVHKGTESDLWSWIERYAAALAGVGRIEFVQCIEHTPLIGHFLDQLRAARIATEMSNHQSASFDMRSISFIHGQKKPKTWAAHFG